MTKRLYSTTLWFLLGFLLSSNLYAQTPPPGISGQAFRDWIKQNFYDGFHSTLGYSTSRMYMYNYIDNQNNTIVDVYGGFVQPWTYGGTGTNPAPINAEHTIPQSFFGSSEPMQSDIHHLFPSLDIWNSTRSNHPFEDIDDNVTTKWMRDNQSQTTIPTSNIDEYSEYANQQFEPREDHKGDCARAIFYFYTMYPTQAGSITSVADINTLYQWHLQDPVSAKESQRNTDIETYQGNRNPYVDNPSWVEDAWNLTPSAPDAPTNLSLIAGSTFLTLTWTDVLNESGYEVYRSTDNVSFSLVATLSSNASSYTNTGLSAGTTYYYYLVAYNSYGSSPNSSTVSGSPTGGSSGGNATDLFLSEYIEGSSFNKALEIANFTGAVVDMSSYSLKKETNGGGTWDTDYPLSGSIADGDVWVIAHSSADAAILAQADISTGSGIVTFNGNDVIGLFKNNVLIDVIGDFGTGANFAQDVTLIRKPEIGSPSAVYLTAEWDSYPANTFSDIGIHTFNGGSTPTPPAIPANLQLTATTTSLDLTWDDVADEDGFQVFRSSDNVSFTQIADLGAGVLSYSDNTLTLEATYYYYVEAYNTAGSSGASNTVSGATLPVPPATPANLSLFATTIDLNLMWDDVANEDGYLVFRSDDNVSFTQIASLTADDNSYTDNTVQLLTTYYYYVVAFNNGGNSGNSNVVSGQTESTGGNASDLLISEYIEGSSFNKALEIANFTGSAVDLSSYTLKKETNGGGVWADDYPLSGTLAHGDVWVIAHSSASGTILAQADVSTGSGIVTFNGNDVIGLFKNGTLIDEVGDFGSGGATFAQDVTLVRKSSVTSPSANYNTTEWDSYASDTFGFLGSHTINGSTPNPPATPANLTLITSQVDLTLNWDDVADEDGYLVYRSADNITFSQQADLGAGITTYADNTVALQTTYYYYVVAYNAGGNSGNSNTVSGQTDAPPAGASDLFISEYIEGSQSNTAIEIANFTGGSVDLSAYSIRKQSNGSGSWQNEYFLSGNLADGSVFVIGHSNASSSITNIADALVNGGVMDFSGNDPIGLFKNGVLIDIVGTFNGGRGNFGRNTTLVRKSSVTSPNTTYTTSEWDAYGSNTFSFLGTHSYGSGARLVASSVIITEVTAWPNPFEQKLTIRIETLKESQLEAHLFNMMGQKVKTILPASELFAGTKEITVPTGDLPAGIYLVTVIADNQKKVIRVVK